MTEGYCTACGKLIKNLEEHNHSLKEIIES